MDRALCIAFNLTGWRWISDRISTRRAEQRWAACVAAHKAAGGDVVTVEHAAGGTSAYLI